MTKGERLLQERFGTQKKASTFYDNQMLDYLNEQMIEFIGKQSMVFIATADSEGNCDSSFRAGLAGFVRVVSDKKLIYPEYKGNGVMASLGNILENPHIGLMFIDFFEHNIGLHVNGLASIIENKDLSSLRLPTHELADIAEKEGDRPERWVVIEVDEAYIHCSKHIPMLKQVDKPIHWGTDDERQKGGDFFKVKYEKRS